MIIRVSRSWASPHMITFQDWSRFYSRNSAGKYPLDVMELRSAFLLSETAAERIRRFRAERIGRIIAGDTPIPMGEGAKIILHLIPLIAFRAAVQFDLNPLRHNPPAPFIQADGITVIILTGS